MRDQGFTMIVMVIATAIVVCLMGVLLRGYLQRSSLYTPAGESVMQEGTGTSSSDAGIDTRSYTSIVESTRQQMESIQDQHVKDLESLLQ